jgi:hypothetical protein
MQSLRFQKALSRFSVRRSYCNKIVLVLYIYPLELNRSEGFFVLGYVTLNPWIDVEHSLHDPFAAEENLSSAVGPAWNQSHHPDLFDFRPCLYQTKSAHSILLSSAHLHAPSQD